MMIRRWDPFREMVTMRRAMDRLIENGFDGEELPASEWSLPLDVVENEDGYTVKASIPGVKSEDLDITLDKGMLTIRGELKNESETQQGQYHLRELRFGMFTRTISLPTSVRPDDIQASCEDGILTLTMPKAEEVKPKRIQVGGSKMIEGQTK